MSDRQTGGRRAGLPCVAWLGAALLALPGFAQACTATVQAPIIVDRDRSGYSDQIRMIWDDGTNVQFNGCGSGSSDDLHVQLDGADLQWVMDHDFSAWPLTGPLPLYQTGPDSALVGFAYADLQIMPLRLGANVVADGLRNGGGVPMLFVLSRGTKMRDFSTQAQMLLSAPSHPGMAGIVPVSIDMRFPATTCLLQDATTVLEDAALHELDEADRTARERPVRMTMDCGADIARADIRLWDAGDASNTGSTLTPTADSDATGVRVQLLKDDVEVQFGTPWFFNPGVSGSHELSFTARYLRLPETLAPGRIKGEALVEVDYW